MRRLTSFSARIASQDPNRQTGRIRTRIALTKCFFALYRTEIVCVL